MQKTKQTRDMNSVHTKLQNQDIVFRNVVLDSYIFMI